MKHINKIRYPSHILEVYRSPESQEWYFRFTHVNHNITGRPSEGYKKRSMALSNLMIMHGVVVSPKLLPKRGGFSAQVNLLGKVRVTI